MFFFEEEESRIYFCHELSKAAWLCWRLAGCLNIWASWQTGLTQQQVRLKLLPAFEEK